MDALKGVMLSERPTDHAGPGPQSSGSAGDSTAAFRVGGKLPEQLGLPTALKPPPAKAKKDTALTKHLRWLRETQKKTKEQKQAEEEKVKKVEAKKAKLLEEQTVFRAAVLDGTIAAEGTAAAAAATSASEPKETPSSAPEPEETLKVAEPEPAPAPAPDLDELDAEMAALLDGAVAEVVAVTESEPKPGKQTKAAAGGKKKPVWALTEEEAEAQEAEELDDLLSFADELDYDKFIEEFNDAEMSEMVAAMEEAERPVEEGGVGPMSEEGKKIWKKNFVRAMNHLAGKAAAGTAMAEAEAAGGRDPELMSATASTRAREHATRAKIDRLRAVKDDEGAWDSSTVAGDDSRDAIKAATASADAFLRDNPQLQGVHSTASVRALLNSAKGKIDAAVSPAPVAA